MWTPIHILLFFFPLIFLFLSHPRMNNRQSNNSHISRKSVPIAISPIVRYPKSCREWQSVHHHHHLNEIVRNEVDEPIRIYKCIFIEKRCIHAHLYIFEFFLVELEYWNGTGWPWFAFDWDCVVFPAGRVRLSIVICFRSVRMVYTNDEQDDLAISPTTARGKL